MMVSEPEKVKIFFRYSFSNMHTVSFPMQWLDDMIDAGADQYTFHLEATGDIYSSI